MTYEYWIYQQMEPGDKITTARPVKSNHHPVVSDEEALFHAAHMEQRLSEEEHNRQQDEYLESKIKNNG